MGFAKRGNGCLFQHTTLPALTAHQIRFVIVQIARAFMYSLVSRWPPDFNETTASYLSPVSFASFWEINIDLVRHAILLIIRMLVLLHHSVALENVAALNHAILLCVAVKPLHVDGDVAPVSSPSLLWGFFTACLLLGLWTKSHGRFKVRYSRKMPYACK